MNADHTERPIGLDPPSGFEILFASTSASFDVCLRRLIGSDDSDDSPSYCSPPYCANVLRNRSINYSNNDEVTLAAIDSIFGIVGIGLRNGGSAEPSSEY